MIANRCRFEKPQAYWSHSADASSRARTRSQLPSCNNRDPRPALQDAYEAAKEKAAELTANVTKAIVGEVEEAGVAIALQRAFTRYEHGAAATVRGGRVVDMVTAALDVHMSGGDEPVVFNAELKKLLASPATVRYLSTLEARLVLAEATQTPLDLWAHTLSECGGNRAQALQFIAVLFQDISPSQAHVKHAKAKGYGTAAVRALLANVNTHLLQSNMVQRCPGALEVKVSKALYHFYVVAHAVALAHTKRPDQASEIAAAGFTFNNLYEYEKAGAISHGDIALSTQAFEKNIAALKTYGDPATFGDILSDNDLLDDTYMGYAGALFGAGLERETVSRASFRERFAAGPQAFIQQHFAFPSS